MQDGYRKLSYAKAQWPLGTQLHTWIVYCCASSVSALHPPLPPSPSPLSPPSPLLSSQGILTNETRCLCCETVTARDETFLDLSLDIEQNSSVTSCLRNFSSTETLNGNDKFYCDECRG